MLKTLIAGIAALSLTFASVAPVQAQAFDREEIGKLVIGLAVIAALNAALERRDRERSTRNNNNSSGGGNSASRYALPESCLQNVATRFGNQRMFGKNCLQRSYRHVDRLPDRCAVRVFTRSGPANGFDPFCLREAGFTTDRRR